jgi:uncharacterized protein
MPQAPHPAASMPPCRNHLLLFTRYPEAGATKTRLIPALGAEGAADLQRRLTERMVAEIHVLATRIPIHAVIHYCGGSAEKMAAWLGPMPCVPQVEGDLGQRMQQALAHSFAGGAEKAILIGSDIPGITANLLAEAFSSLGSAKAAIGPSRDGGYYLLGVRAEAAAAIYPLVFERMSWSTPQVFALTCRRLASASLAPALLPLLSDIDTPEDLALARARGWI